MLTPEERVRQARYAAHCLHGSRDSRELTAAARAASPASLDYFLRRVDEAEPGLPDEERERRAEHLRKAWFIRLAQKSADVRRRRRAGAR